MIFSDKSFWVPFLEYIGICGVIKTISYLLTRRFKKEIITLNAKHKRLALEYAVGKRVKKSKVEGLWESYLILLEDSEFLYNSSKEELEFHLDNLAVYLEPLQKSPKSVKKIYTEEIDRLQAIQSKLQYFLEPLAYS